EASRLAPGEAAARSEPDGSTSFVMRGGLLVLTGLVLLLLAEATGSVQALFGLVLLAVYFLPSLIATKRGHHQTGAIAVVNVFLGWTFIGWVIALAMACSAVRPHSGATSEQG
ncbi:MAG TPA: superinfection immunity protein, partial [Thermoanaerobaculia bacterium]|nr:superinfection immunity protein [Thermoanaerobaculia bacterium]